MEAVVTVNVFNVTRLSVCVPTFGGNVTKACVRAEGGGLAETG